LIEPKSASSIRSWKSIPLAVLRPRGLAPAQAVANDDVAWSDGTIEQATSCRLCCLNIISYRHVVLRGNPGPPTVWRRQGARRRPLFCLGFRLFFNTAENRLSGSSEAIQIIATIS
jgi:hypothetical protein